LAQGLGSSRLAGSTSFVAAMAPKKRSTSRTTSSNPTRSTSQTNRTTSQSRGGAAAKREASKETPEQAKLRVQHGKYDVVFAKYDGGGKGALKKAELLQIVRDCNDEYTFLDDRTMPEFMRKSWTEASPDEEGLVCFANFAAWYEGFLEHLAAIKEKDRQAASAKAMEQATMFASDGQWSASMRQLPDALSAAWAKKKVPLLVDMTGEEDNGYTPLETYYTYSGHMLIDMKKMVVQVNMKKELSVEDALLEERKKLVLALKRGLNLVFMLSNSAPPFKSQFSSPTALPYELVDDYEAVRSVIGDGNAEGDAGADWIDWKKVPWTSKLLQQSDDIVFVHKDFNVVVVTKFSPDDYAGFLKDQFPVEKMQHILVNRQ